MKAETHILQLNGYWLHSNGNVCAYFKQRIFDGKYQYFYWDYSTCNKKRASVCMIPKENCALNLRDPDNKQITVKTEKPILIEQTQESTPSIFRFLTSLLGTIITVLTALIVYVQTFTENDDAEKIPRNKIVPDISLVDDSCQTYTINANGSEKAIQTTNMMQSFSTTFHNDNEQDTLK